MKYLEFEISRRILCCFECFTTISVSKTPDMKLKLDYLILDFHYNHNFLEDKGGKHSSILLKTPLLIIFYCASSIHSNTKYKLILIWTYFFIFLFESWLNFMLYFWRNFFFYLINFLLFERLFLFFYRLFDFSFFYFYIIWIFINFLNIFFQKFSLIIRRIQ